MTRRSREAEPNLRESFTVGGALADLYPGRLDYVLDLVASQLRHAARLDQAKRTDEAATLVQDVLTRARAISEKVVDRSAAARILLEIANQLGLYRRRHEALKVYEMAMAANPGDREIETQLAWFLVGRPSDQPPHDPQRALRLLDHDASRSPHDPSRVQARALAYYRLGRPEDAQRAFASERNETADDPVSWIIQSLALQASGEHDQAKKRYQQAVDWRKAKRQSSPELDALIREAAGALDLSTAGDSDARQSAVPVSD